MRRLGGWPPLIIASAVAAGLGTLFDIDSPIRTAITFWFLLICPGIAYVRLLGIEERLTQLTLAIALSIAINTIVSGIMLYAGVWSPELGFFVVIGLSVIGAIVLMIRS